MSCTEGCCVEAVATEKNANNRGTINRAIASGEAVNVVQVCTVPPKRMEWYVIVDQEC